MPPTDKVEAAAGAAAARPSPTSDSATAETTMTTTMTTTPNVPATKMPLLPITSHETIDACRSLPLRPNDVFICSYPKSGTTWTQHVVLSLILASKRAAAAAGGINDSSEAANEEEAVEVIKHVSDYAPFFEIDAHWVDEDCGGDGGDNGGGDNSADEEKEERAATTTKKPKKKKRLAAHVRRNHDRLGRRVFNTHLRWDMLPKRATAPVPPPPRRRSTSDGEDDGNCDNDDDDDDDDDDDERPECGKFIYVVRSLPDVCASFYHHLSNQVEGGYTDGTYDDFLLDWMEGRIAFGSPLDHIESYARGFDRNEYHRCPRRCNGDGEDGDGSSYDDRPLLLLSFEELKFDLTGAVRKLRDFLNLDVPDAVLANELIPTFGFEHMKSNLTAFQPRSVSWKNDFQFLRGGRVGDGTRLLNETKSRVEAYQAWIERERFVERINSIFGRDEDGARGEGTEEGIILERQEALRTFLRLVDNGTIEE